MAEYNAGGLSVADVLAMIASNSAISFVGDPTTTMTVASLIATYPPSSTYLNKYARVSDLYGSVDDIMRCRFDGTNYRWVPQRESFNGTNAATSGTVTITPLVTPPSLRLTGTLLGNLDITASTTNAYRGQRQRVINNGVLGVFVATITNLVGSNVTILGGGFRDMEFNGTAWFAA